MILDELKRIANSARRRYLALLVAWVTCIFYSLATQIYALLRGRPDYYDIAIIFAVLSISFRPWGNGE